jgi:ABC-type Zn2+ transport system substrate-binding protein/surface adhesin
MFMKTNLMKWLVIAVLLMSTLNGCFVFRGRDDRDRDRHEDRDRYHDQDRGEHHDHDENRGEMNHHYGY